MAGLMSKGSILAKFNRVGLQSVRTMARDTSFMGDPAKHEGSMKLWRNLSFLVAIPAVVLLTIRTYVVVTEEHKHHERPPFVKYDHMRIRTKKFPWGDGDHSLFHNPHFNPGKDGYEDEH